ncbi:MAG: GDP-mannose 4,6-dehydratase [Solirubrobacterales bacterium]
MNDQTAKRALITGVSGFAGRHLAELLVQNGWAVSGTTNTRSCDVAGVTSHALQIDDVAALGALIGSVEPDVVFHLAAIVDTVRTPSIMELHRVNTMGTVAVTEAIAESGSRARLVFASSSFAYGRVGENSAAIPESTELRPVTAYGASKAAAEQIVWQHARLRDADVVVTRAFQHTGPGHTGAYALADWGRQLAEIEQRGEHGAIATGNLAVERDYLDVRDVAAAYLAVAERGHRGGTYNVCSGEPLAMEVLLRGLIASFGIEVEIETDARRLRKVDQPVFAGDPRRLSNDTGWRRRVTLEDTLDALASYWRART